MTLYQGFYQDDNGQPNQFITCHVTFPGMDTPTSLSRAMLPSRGWTPQPVYHVSCYLPGDGHPNQFITCHVTFPGMDTVVLRPLLDLMPICTAPCEPDTMYRELGWSQSPLATKAWGGNWVP